MNKVLDNDTKVLYPMWYANSLVIRTLSQEGVW